MAFVERKEEDDEHHDRRDAPEARRRAVKAARDALQFRARVGHHVRGEDEVDVGAEAELIEHAVGNRNRVDPGLDAHEDRAVRAVDFVRLVGRRDARDAARGLHRHEDRRVKAHPRGLETPDDGEFLVVKLNLRADLPEDVVAHDHFVADQGTLDLGAKPGRHDEVAFLVDPDQLHLHRAALRVQRRNEKLARSLGNAGDLPHDVEHAGVEIEGGRIRAEENAFDLLSFALGDDEQVRAHAGGERLNPRLEVRRHHRARIEHEGEDRDDEGER